MQSSPPRQASQGSALSTGQAIQDVAASLPRTGNEPCDYQLQLTPYTEQGAPEADGALHLWASAEAAADDPKLRGPDLEAN